jgi:hypothetical protein
MNRASQWRDKSKAAHVSSAVDLELPSGAVVKFCRPHLFTWVGGGRMPESFVSILSKVARTHGSLAQKEAMARVEIEKLSQEDHMKYNTFLTDLVIASVLDPRIIKGPLQTLFEKFVLAKCVERNGDEVGTELFNRLKSEGKKAMRAQLDLWEVGPVPLDEYDENEISIDEIPEVDLTFLLAQALQLAPTVPVETKGGDVPLAAVEEFRFEPGRGFSSVISGDMSEVPQAALGSPGDLG